jgi:hypothetical protein
MYSLPFPICVRTHMRNKLQQGSCIYTQTQGEYVAPEKIENVFAKSHFVRQSFVYGDSLHAVLVAVIVPHEHAAMAWASAQPATDCVNSSIVTSSKPSKLAEVGAQTNTWNPVSLLSSQCPFFFFIQICANPAFINAVMDDVTRVAKVHAGVVLRLLVQ